MWFLALSWDRHLCNGCFEILCDVYICGFWPYCCIKTYVMVGLKCCVFDSHLRLHYLITKTYVLLHYFITNTYVLLHCLYNQYICTFALIFLPIHVYFCIVYITNTYVLLHYFITNTNVRLLCLYNQYICTFAWLH